MSAATTNGAIEAAIAICATFTAEPLRESIEYWLNQLQIPANIGFAPYNQVIQTLLDPRGLFARNKNGLNVVLVRFDDWGLPGDKAAGELIAALETAAAIATSPILVCICPPSEDNALLEPLERDPRIRVLSSARLLELYPVANYYDRAADQLGHMPYTPEAYAVLGTAIARAFQATRRSPFKVIVTDCDNTLWSGICGEKGAQGIELDPPSRAVQNFLKARQSEGMLLCVCSKNAEEDVVETFDGHPEMPLRREDFTGWRVNWRPKSENIRALASELSLGLDSFIFLDDNPMETAEVEAHCPGVLALTLPADRSLIPRFLDHVWAFDQTGVTAEDRKRTVMYRENALRGGAQAGALSYADFIRGLELEVEIRELSGAAEIERAAQMTQRTNQFNFATRRFTAPQIREMLSRDSTGILAAFVRDRYGDYGQVGLVMFEPVDDVLHIRDFLLSCRVLGKGVEHVIVRRLGEIAMARSLSAVEIAYASTPKNMPARDFLDSLGTHRLPSEAAAAMQFSPSESGPRTAEIDSVPMAQTSSPRIDYAWIATHRSDAASILEAVREAQGTRVGAALEGSLPRDEIEKKLARIWERVLRISPIGIHDNFFDLGGDSFVAVRLLSDLGAMTGRELPLVALVEAPTIARLAEMLRGDTREGRWNCLVPIKSAGGRPPFYCVHGEGGNVLEFMDLARHVHPDQPFYGIQAIGLSGPTPEKRFTIEEMAREYILEIREFQREGPYYLGGSSFGGWVAYEMARQLTEAGRAVGLVAMFDTAVPGMPPAPGIGNALRLRIETLIYRFTLHWQNAMVLASHERLSYLRGKARRIADRMGNRGSLPDAIQWVIEAGRWAASVYFPGEYSGGVTLFRATNQPPWFPSDATLGWQKLAKGGVQIYHTPGHHADLVRNPRARVLARQLNDALEKAQARARARTFVAR